LSKFQVLPDLLPEEYEQLKSDIQQRGVMVPIEYDEIGNILDGHHRVKACIELGITEWPRLVRRGMSDEEKKAHAIALNIARRHLKAEQMRPYLVEMRKSGMTLQAIAAASGVSKDTVRRSISTFSNEKVALPAKVPGKDGKARPTKYRPRQTVYISTEVAKQAASLPGPHRDAVLLGEKKPMEASREARIESISKTANLPEAKYRVVYADPPWSYGNTQPDYHTEQRDHYPVMEMRSICEMRIREICEDNAVLFLWVTSPILEESFDVIRAWGFKYKASFVWDKIKHNMGHYNSVRHEFLLICTRGSCQPDVRKLFDSVVAEERSKHSAKPEVFYEIIEALYPHGKRIELFSRRNRDGWDVYGNEV
jgi:N6-adenosine-specific RNA methylase IME4